MEVFFIEVAALVAAAAAAFFAGYQAMLSRQHNRLAVQPLLDWRADFDGETGRYRLDLINAGLGPAVVWNIRIYHVDTEVGPIGEETCALMSELIQRGQDRWSYSCYTVGRYPQDAVHMLQADTETLFESFPAGPEKGPFTPIDVSAFRVSAQCRSFYEWNCDLHGEPPVP